jgi:SRSO17 transposase
MEQILSCFERYFSKRQFTSLLFILHLLLASERKQLSCAEGKSESAFSRFLGIYKWDPEAVNEARIQEHWAEVEIYMQQYHLRHLILRLILDDTVVPKSGTAFDRLGVHYSSTLDKTVRGHCFVVLYARMGPFRFPVAYRWYLNEVYCPEAGMEFKTKPQLALEMLKKFTFPATLRVSSLELLVDGGYAEKDILHYADSEGWYFYARLTSNRNLEEIQFVGVGGKKYGKPLSQVKSGEIVTPSYLGQKVKVVRQRGEKGPRYLMTNCLTASNSKVRKRAKLRWEVEVFFRRSKQHLGFGDYRVRRWQAIEKYILSVWIAYMIALSEPPPSGEDSMTLIAHQQVMAWKMLQSRLKEYLLAKLLILKNALEQVLIPRLLL